MDRDEEDEERKPRRDDDEDRAPAPWRFDDWAAS
jgi:hypothetical protein